MKKQLAAGVVAGAFLIGTAGAALVLPKTADAANPTATPSATQSTTGGTTGTQLDPGQGGRGGMGGMHGGPGGLDADDLTAAAKALGMTEADLTTALTSGKTAAAVAKEQGVDLQKVIDAIVAADKAELAAAVKAGTMTQAPAAQMTANLSQHVTDEVNGVAGGPDGMGGHGHGGPGDGNGQAPVAPGATSGTGTSG